jgi:hypothetical protein
VKASPEPRAFNRGRSGGQQVRKPPVRNVAAVLPLGVQEDWGEEGRGERPKLRGPEARRRVVKRHPPSNECSAAVYTRAAGTWQRCLNTVSLSISVVVLFGVHMKLTNSG